MCLKPYFKKYFFHYVFGLLAIVAVDIIQLQMPVIIGKVTDGLQMGTMTRDELMGLIVSLLLIGVSVTVLRFVWRQFIFGTGRRIEFGLRNDFFAHLETLSTNFYNQQKTGDLMAYATNDLNAIRMLVGPGILMLLDTVVLTTIVVAQMVLTTDLTLTIFAVLPMPIIAIGSLLLGKVIRQRFDNKQRAFAHMSDIVQENISGIRVIKAFVQETYEILAFGEVNKENYEKNMKVVRLNAVMMPMAMLITGISIAIALGYGGRLTMLGVISLGDFVAFIQYIMMLIWPMIAFGWFVNIYSQGRASLKRFQDILDTKPEIVDYTKERDKEIVVKGNIEFKNLDFSYPNSDEATLKNINMQIQQGQRIGIVGRTGSGKTTLVNLLLRLFEVPDNTLLIDGIPIKELPLKGLRNSIGYVPQDNFLFSDTLSGNIGFGLDEWTMEMVENAAKNVDVHDNIIEFEEQYDTVVGERGVTLSGGQKQRVSIARALIKEPSILILDDAVSAVDTKTEERILEHLRKVRQNKTTIMIAHRISTVQDSDYIYVLDEGSILEEGTHQQLIDNNGLYQSMVMKQQLEKSIDETE